MKTSIVMFREMNGIQIRQDTKTSFFNANDVLDLFNKQNGEAKRLQNYFDNEATGRYMNALVSQVIDNHSNSSELENPLISTKRGKNGGTWMHPYLFIDFAMWLSPEFKASVIKWVYDNLIVLRIESGDGFKDVNQALFDTKPNSAPFTYANEAKMINKIVFGTPDRDQRNTATEDQLSLLKSLQKADKQLILDGFDYYERFDKLREIKKYL
jgi:hypothetical protein